MLVCRGEAGRGLWVPVCETKRKCVLGGESAPQAPKEPASRVGETLPSTSKVDMWAFPT